MESQFPNDDEKGSTLCRQSSSRWTPTTEQIRILKDLYYNNGVRSPSADQIQKISAKLRQYGKIEGKNVFYWFQNHKARERQKKRLTTDAVFPMQRSGLWKNTDAHESFYPCKYPNNVTSGAPSSSACAPGLVSNYGYASLVMEKSFRDCSLSADFNGVNGSNFSWGGAPDSVNNTIPQMAYPFLDQYKRSGEDDQYEQGEEHEVQEIETLPLFPMHGDEDGFRRCNKQPYPTNWHQYPINGNMGYSRASLELTLNSYGAGWSDNNS